VQGRYEVDFIIEVGRECLAIEVKSASRWGRGTRRVYVPSSRR
jgi:predicted AAA+ superfamily ATPase